MWNGDMEPEANAYKIELRPPSALTPADLDALIAILKKDGAVNTVTTRQQLPHALALALASRGPSLVALGAIKQPRPNYTIGLRKHSGVAFDSATPELGYVAVASEHRGQGLSHSILSALLRAHLQPVFATTDSAAMKKTLVGAKFVQCGTSWKGKRGQLSLWISPGLILTS
jgi:hypothetical protein